MSARRPRVKAAAILKPRRPQTSANENNVKTESNVEQTTATSSTIPIESTINNSSNRIEIDASTEKATINQESMLELKPITDQIVVNSSRNHLNKLNQNGGLADAVDLVENKPPDVSASSTKNIPKSSSSSSPAATPFRRISTPPVNIANRRKSLIVNTDNRSGYGSPKYIKSPLYSFVRDQPSKDAKPYVIQSPHHNVNTKPSHIDDEVFSPAPIENDECFKSPPFMSPIYTRRIDPNMSPFHDIYGEDYTKSPSAALPNNNNTKIRQRIRPTPCFASRRNSIQGNSGWEKKPFFENIL